jgi:hypothetical protein
LNQNKYLIPILSPAIDYVHGCRQATLPIILTLIV